MTLKQARKKCGGYTQKELAELVGVSEMTVSNWERGVSQT
ncbi:MAG: helix-turn-helix transcriptional regulator [Clostridia bacterium]|nr:helix-turn-helix transcriptional regulator [Clostridia bacterium]